MGMSKQDREKLVEDAKEALTERLAAIANDPAQWLTWIDQVAEFGAQYSFNNQFLLLMQAAQRRVEPEFFQAYGPRDPQDRSYGWRKYHRHVRKGEQAFLVWAPIRRRPTEEQARELEAAGRKVRREPGGRPSMQVTGFRLSSTFELSQTDPDEGYEHVEFVVPTVAVQRRQKLGGRDAELLTGEDPTGVYDDVVKLMEARGYTFSVVPRDAVPYPGGSKLGTANGRCIGGGVMRVLVAEDLEPAARIKTTIHEWAHIECEHLDGTRIGEDLHRGRRETEAESVAHIVCKALGLDTAAYTDAYVLNWAEGDMDVVRAAMETVMRVSKKILADLTPADDTADPDHAAELV